MDLYIVQEEVDGIPYQPVIRKSYEGCDQSIGKMLKENKLLDELNKEELDDFALEYAEFASKKRNDLSVGTFEGEYVIRAWRVNVKI